MKVFGTVEIKPGVDPTARHVQNLIAGMKAEHVSIVIREPQFPEKVPKLIAEQGRFADAQCVSCGGNQRARLRAWRSALA